MDKAKNTATQDQCLQAFLDNLRKEQDALCLNDVDDLKDVLQERERLFAQALQMMESSPAENSCEHKQQLAAQIEQQSLRNQYLLEKRLEFNKTLMQSFHPKEADSMTYDGSGTRKSTATKRVLINREV